LERRRSQLFFVNHILQSTSFINKNKNRSKQSSTKKKRHYLNVSNRMALQKLTFAASGLDPETGSLKQLLSEPDTKVLLNLIDADGCTLLMTAAQSDEIGNMALLVSMGADVNAANQGGQTALMQAAACGQVSAVEWLLEHGAMVHLVDANGMNALIHSNAQCPCILAHIERLLATHTHLMDD